MLVLHDDISTGKRCVAVQIVADGAYDSTSHGFMVLCRDIDVLTKDQHLVANEKGQYLLMDATMTDGRMTLTIVTSGSNTHLVFTQRL